MAFEFADSPVPVRADIGEAQRRAWRHLASPGTWLTSCQRLAIAGETRAARSCGYCTQRKAALSPHAVDGTHDSVTDLPPEIVDAVHRLTTDPGRLTRSWYEDLMETGLPPTHYVEILGVVTTMVAVDGFHLALGLALEPLPDIIEGEPSRISPAGAEVTFAWVPTTGRHSVVNVMSLVPAEVEAFLDLHGAHYLSIPEMGDMTVEKGLTRPQMELVAGRVSSLNECFY